MLVKCLKQKKTSTHDLKKGKLYNLPSRSALELIENKVCKIPTKKEAEVYNHGNQ